jgi:hypothetical protein
LFFKRGVSELRVTYKAETQPDRAIEPAGFFAPLRHGLPRLEHARAKPVHAQGIDRSARKSTTTA